MRRLTNLGRVISLLFILCGALTSCKSKTKPYIQDLSDSIYYCDVNSSYEFEDIINGNFTFKKLETSQKNNLSGLISDKDNYIWLKVEFKIAPELKGKTLGLCIGHLRSADKLYLNNNFIRQYGEFLPYENTSGFQSHYYMFPTGTLKDETNTIYICVWPGALGSISKSFFISEQSYVFNKSELLTFMNSRIIITFMAVSILICIVYSILYFILRGYRENRMYLIYALMNLFTALFLLAFCFSELPFLKAKMFPYLLVLKLTFLFGGASTVYFASSFIISYLGYDPSYKEINVRMGIFLGTALCIFVIPSYQLLIKLTPYLILLALSQFAFFIPRIFICLANSQKRPDVFKMLHGFSPVLVVIPVDIVLKLILKIEDLPYLTLYAWQITIYVFLWELLKQFGHLYVNNATLTTKLEELNSNLEEVVSLRTRELSEANYVLSRGLETVAHVQKNFLPPSENTFPGWDISIYYKPLDNNVSGDLYDYYSTNNSLDGVGIFDVSGHGIPAGLMTILAKGIISQQFISGIAQDESTSDILQKINQTYIREKVNVENSITGLLFRFSGFNVNDVCSVEFANAGHPYPLLYSASKDSVIELKYEDPDQQYGLIGIEGLDVSFPPISFRMGQNDIILCFTDGITEAINNAQQDFGKQRLIDILQEYHDSTPAEITEKIISCLNDFIGEHPVNDDITLIVLKRTNSCDFIEEI